MVGIRFKNVNTVKFKLQNGALVYKVFNTCHRRELSNFACLQQLALPLQALHLHVDAFWLPVAKYHTVAEVRYAYSLSGMFIDLIEY